MGWMFTLGQTRRELIEHLTEEQVSEGRVRMRTLAHCTVGNHLWAVHELMGKAETFSPEFPAKFICLYLLAPHKGYGWGYKDISEEMGPVEVSCPLKYLELAPESCGDYSNDWRERVRKHHAEQAAKREFAKQLKDGDMFTVYGKEFKYLEKDKRHRGQIVGLSVEYGMLYRIKPTQITLPQEAR